ncbi:AlwI family type II restriction endonuclease [Lacticaseibacillus rhamnosus]|uniref:AlwI family type II restriction endonuclease n=1 Tax=Lacticaseibacillus rhamnosus TaxID=47715 RepID=UPI0031F57835
MLLNNGFSGDLDSKVRETNYARALDKAGIIKKDMQAEDQSSVARKWRSAFDKNGFITPKLSRNLNKNTVIFQVIERHPDMNLSAKPYEITPQGRRLARATTTYEIQDTILRALLALQTDSYELPGKKFKPFVFVLQVMDKLRKNRQREGINERELILIGSVTDHAEAENVAQKIISYRSERNQITGKQNKAKFDVKYFSSLADDFGVKYDTLFTYTNPNFNYMLTTGLFSRQGKRLVFNEDRLDIISDILHNEPHIITDDIEYYYQLWNGYPLPTDNADVLIAEIKRLSSKLGYSFSKKIQSATIPDLKQKLTNLQSKDDEIRESEYARAQGSEKNIIEIIKYLQVLNGNLHGGDEFDNAKFDLPTYFEWACWRAFLAIDGLKNTASDARGFNVDQDLYPIGNAPGGRPDILLEYDKFILVVEVTLTSTSRQEAAEAEPVRRHVAEVQAAHPRKPVYGLFLAKTLDNNTAEMFRVGLWYEQDNPHFVNIVPMTLDQFIYIMQNFLKSHFDNAQVERLIEKCLIPRNATVGLWKQEIDRTVQNYHYAL